jgi:hypothetical protein
MPSSALFLYLGCFFISFSLPLCLLVSLGVRRKYLLIPLLLSSLALFLSLLVSSIFTYIFDIASIPIEVSVVYCVVLLEIARFFLVAKAYRETEQEIRKAVRSDSSLSPVINDVSSSISIGVGFGTMKLLTGFGSTFFDETILGNLKGARFSASSHLLPSLATGSIISFLIFLMDIGLMCIAFAADKSRRYSMFLFVGACHLSATLVTLLHEEPNSIYYTIPMILSILVLVLVVLRLQWHVLSS